MFENDNFFTANWDGIYDNETGLLGYSVTAGEKICEEKIKAHHDPHAHLFDESQWTNSVMMTPLEPPYTVLPGIQNTYISFVGFLPHSKIIFLYVGVTIISNDCVFELCSALIIIEQ